MNKINIARTKEFPLAEFEIIVKGNSVTHHKVTITKDYFDKLTGGKVPPEKLVELSFNFLLDHESNTSILSAFDLKVISSYFPEYESKMKALLNF